MFASVLGVAESKIAPSKAGFCHLSQVFTRLPQHCFGEHQLAQFPSTFWNKSNTIQWHHPPQRGFGSKNLHNATPVWEKWNNNILLHPRLSHAQKCDNHEKNTFQQCNC